MGYTLTLTRRMFILLIAGVIVLFVLLFIFGLELGRRWPIVKEQCVDMILMDGKPTVPASTPAQAPN